jgi:DNA topoisomerase-1
MALGLSDQRIPVPELRAANLSYASDLDPGIRRKKAARGFNYLDADGKPISDPQTLDRIQRLVIPPAWTDVWISPSERSHLQATGRDVRGRKQYRYHERWREVRDSDKYDRLIAFGRALPKLRARVSHDLRRRGLPREKVLAAVIRVMEITLIRIGNEEYAKTNKTFGLTTLRNRHARISSRTATFEFRGKSGKVHKTGFSDRRLARILKACQELPGQRLFQYLGEDGERHCVDSADVNAYLHDALGDEFSAKDFRTWAGTLAAARALVTLAPCQGDGEARKNVVTCVKAVAALLGNTPAVCRKAYIDPAVLESYEAGELRLKATRSDRSFELAVLAFLEKARDHAAARCA